MGAYEYGKNASVEWSHHPLYQLHEKLFYYVAGSIIAGYRDTIDLWHKSK